MNIKAPVYTVPISNFQEPSGIWKNYQKLQKEKCTEREALYHWFLTKLNPIFIQFSLGLPNVLLLLNELTQDTI
jgi:hypothetical protein